MCKQMSCSSFKKLPINYSLTNHIYNQDLALNNHKDTIKHQ